MATRTTTSLSADEQRDLIATVIQGVAGGSKAAWRKAVGPVERLPTWRYVTHNWQVSPTGTAAQRDLVDRAAAVVRAEHPYIA